VAVPPSNLDNCGRVSSEREDAVRASVLIFRTGWNEYPINRGSERVADERVLEDGEWVAASGHCTPTSNTMPSLFANELEIFGVQAEFGIGVRSIRRSPNEAFSAGVKVEVAIHSEKCANVAGKKRFLNGTQVL
jgi:hypothetical protein